MRCAILKENFIFSMYALMFPGQGAQAVGMGRSVYEAFPEAREVLARADDLLGYRLSTLMFEGPVERLNTTRFTQPALFVTSVMILKAWEALYPQARAQIACVAGHSVGEYAALVAAQVLPFEEALALLSTRAEAMEKACPVAEDGQPLGAMCAILGGDLEALIKHLQGYDPKRCALANDNCPGQVVITGQREDVETVRDWAVEQGARKGVMLAVSGPFHSAWMAPAETALRTESEGKTFATATVPLISNVTSEAVTEPEVIKALLPRQVVSPVRWRQSLATMQALDAKTFIEMGCGQVLTGLAKRTVEGQFLSLQTAEDLRAFADALA